MTQANLFCISDEVDRAAVDALPRYTPPVKKVDARREVYTGPFPRKRHYHRCPECKGRGSNGVNCYKQRCTDPVLLPHTCGWCRPVVAPARTNTSAAAWRSAAYGG